MHLDLKLVVMFWERVRGNAFWDPWDGPATFFALRDVQRHHHRLPLKFERDVGYFISENDHLIECNVHWCEGRTIWIQCAPFTISSFYRNLIIHKIITIKCFESVKTNELSQPERYNRKSLKNAFANEDSEKTE